MIRSFISDRKRECTIAQNLSTVHQRVHLGGCYLLRLHFCSLSGHQTMGELRAIDILPVLRWRHCSRNSLTYSMSEAVALQLSRRSGSTVNTGRSPGASSSSPSYPWRPCRGGKPHRGPTATWRPVNRPLCHDRSHRHQNFDRTRLLVRIH